MREVQTAGDSRIPWLEATSVRRLKFPFAALKPAQKTLLSHQHGSSRAWVKEL
jgi:hypothetical protein